MTTPDTRAEVERLLAEHRWDGITVETSGYFVGCVCGHRKFVAGLDGQDLDPAHRTHVATVLAEAGLLADTRPAEPTQGEREALADLLDDLVCDRGVVLDDSRLEWITDALLADGWTRTAPQPHASVESLTEALYGCDFNGSGYMGREDCRAMADAIMPLLTAPQPRADTVKTVEWGCALPDDDPDYYVPLTFTTGEGNVIVYRGSNAEARARHTAGRHAPRTVVRRTRVTTPDVVGPWEPVS